ncbi:MAG: hypothetical protein HY782_25950 [Chloroflexi bacterium]|nr:hypothetical protein [Chloroflexota bacterium]
MDPQILVALIGVAGSALVAVLNQLLAQRVKASENKIAKLDALSMSDESNSKRSPTRATFPKATIPTRICPIISA